MYKRQGEDNEVLLKGPTITPGYYHRDTTNAKAFDKDGFFHTSDAGYLKDGELYLTERIKDPVSYTHLDVYKRQSEDCSVTMSVSSIPE